MARDYRDCLARLAQAAGRQLSDDEIAAVFERIHKAALNIKAGRAPSGKTAGMGADYDSVVQQAAKDAAAQLQAEAAHAERKAYLQVTRLGAITAEVDQMIGNGLTPLDAVEKTIVRDYSGKSATESLEQRVAGHKAYFGRQLSASWEALGGDFLGFLQNREKLLLLVRELRGESTGNAIAAKGAKAFHDTAEEARQTFNRAGGDIGKLDDWGMPQHHSQERVAAAGKQAWTDKIMPMLDRARYTDERTGAPMNDAQVRSFLSNAYRTISTNGVSNIEPGKSGGVGSIANRHAESRQIHFKDADSVIGYWNAFGERTAFEILSGHIDTMARDIAFIEHFGPNPSVTYQTLRDAALKRAVEADEKNTESLQGRAVKLDNLYAYASGRVKPSANHRFSATADAVANLNVAAKLGGAAISSLFGDKVMLEAVSHLNNLPVLQRWGNEIAMLTPTNGAERALLRQQGLMLDGIRSGMQRFYEQLGQTGWTGKFANAVMKITGMNAINELRKGSFGLTLFSAVGNQIKKGVAFGDLHDSDMRLLRNYGITEADWKTWTLADLTDLGRSNTDALLPEAIARIPDAELKQAGIIGQVDGPEVAAEARRNAIVKLLGAVNTESEFAIVQPGWKERSIFHGSVQRGTVPGEIWRSVLQFKSFPFAQFMRAMDLVANKEGPASKAVMTAYVVAATTIAGAMIMQVRDMIAGKDPRQMGGDPTTAAKFWGAAFVQGGALGIYGDFLYGANHTRYGSGILETMAGPTMGPLLEMGLVRPMNALENLIEGKETKLAAPEFQAAKGFIPGSNIWYLKPALDHLVWQQVMEMLSPGYLNTVRQRTFKDFKQDYWWEPGAVAPDRAPNLEAAVK